MKIQSIFAFQIIVILLCFSNTHAFDVKVPPVYDIEESKMYANLSFIAYCTNNCIKSWTCLGGKTIPLIDITQISSFKVFEIKGFIGYHAQKNMIIVTFRGTNPSKVWNDFLDVAIQKTKYPYCNDCKVHSGFYTAYQFLSSQVQGAVRKLIEKYPSARLLTTGHSLGGALSALSALHLNKLFPGKQISNHNFGQPRVGNSEFAAYLTKTLYSNFRVVHMRDSVPHLPPITIFNIFDYFHSPYEVYLSI